MIMLEIEFKNICVSVKRCYFYANDHVGGWKIAKLLYAMDLASQFYSKPSRESPYIVYDRRSWNQRGGSAVTYTELERKGDRAGAALLFGLRGLSHALAGWREAKKRGLI